MSRAALCFLARMHKSCKDGIVIEEAHVNWNALLAATLLGLSVAGGAGARVEGDFEASKYQFLIAKENSDQAVPTFGTNGGAYV